MEAMTIRAFGENAPFELSEVTIPEVYTGQVLIKILVQFDIQM